MCVLFVSVFSEIEASWEEWWTYDGISGKLSSHHNSSLLPNTPDEDPPGRCQIRIGLGCAFTAIQNLNTSVLPLASSCCQYRLCQWWQLSCQCASFLGLGAPVVASELDRMSCLVVVPRHTYSTHPHSHYYMGCTPKRRVPIKNLQIIASTSRHSPVVTSVGQREVCLTIRRRDAHGTAACVLHGFGVPRAPCPLNFKQLLKCVHLFAIQAKVVFFMFPKVH